jgi:xanthine dehydrogenase YagS FAD-binding subunit
VKAFQLQTPRTLAAALELLADQGEEHKKGRVVAPMAGGQDLLTEMKEHLVEPERVVNLKAIPGLDRIEVAGGRVKIGALVTLQQIEEDRSLAQAGAGVRALVEAAHSVASPQIRSVGTLGGNLNQRPRCWYFRLEGARCLKKGGSKCFSYDGQNKYNAILGGGPSYIVHPSDLAPVLVALGAEATLASKSGTRTVPLEKYFTLPDEGAVTRETVLRPDEILTDVSFPLPPAGARSTYVKFKERGSYDFALAAVALTLTIDGGVVRDARLVLGGVAPVPWRVERAEKALIGQKPDAATARSAADLALANADPLEHNGYKVPLAKALVARAVAALAQAT